VFAQTSTALMLSRQHWGRQKEKDATRSCRRPLWLRPALGGYGCSAPLTVHRSPLTPPPSPALSTPAPAPTPVVTAVNISGNTALTAIGEASQLTATATYSDGTTKDVTTTANWMAVAPSVVSIQPGGIVTATAFGVSYIQATFQSKQGFVLVTATPPNTFAVFGRVRERVIEDRRGPHTREPVRPIHSVRQRGRLFVQLPTSISRSRRRASSCPTR
jgi:hypothetical protein